MVIPQSEAELPLPLGSPQPCFSSCRPLMVETLLVSIADRLCNSENVSDLNTAELTAETFCSPLKRVKHLSRYQNPALLKKIEVFKDTRANFKEELIQEKQQYRLYPVVPGWKLPCSPLRLQPRQICCSEIHLN